MYRMMVATLHPYTYSDAVMVLRMLHPNAIHYPTVHQVACGSTYAMIHQQIPIL
jgi:hypothetical protein